MISATLQGNNADEMCFMSFSSTGGTGNTTASDATSISGSERVDPVRSGATFLITGLSAGSHTFTGQYRAFDTSSVCTVSNRNIIVLPLP